MTRDGIFRKRTGFTLVELIIVILLMGVLISAAGSAMIFGMNVNRAHLEEYQFQDEMRGAIDAVEEKLKRASAVFAIQESDYNGSAKDKNWQYIGRADDTSVNAGEIVEYKYDKSSGTWLEFPITKSNGLVSYSLKIEPQSTSGPASKLLVYELFGSPKDKATGLFDDKKARSLKSSVESLNSYTVFNRGTPSDPAVAIAFRDDEKTPPVLSSLVLMCEISEQMTWGMETQHSSNRRDAASRRALKKFAEGFQDTNNLYGTFLVFDQYAEYADLHNTFRSRFVSMKDHANEITNAIDEKAHANEYVGTIYRSGLSNLGDALRAGYVAIDEFGSSMGSGYKNSTNYIVAVVTGVPNSRSYITDNAISSYLGSAVGYKAGYEATAYLLYNPIEGDYGYTSPEIYHRKVAEKFKDKYNTKIYFIMVGRNDGIYFGFERTWPLQETLLMFDQPTSNLILASDDSEIEAAMNQIKEEIKVDMWYVNGPGGTNASSQP